MSIECAHKPVLLDECIEALSIRPDGVYVDGTLGRAGHSSEIAKRLGAGGCLVGIDRDSDAIEAGNKRLGEYKDKVKLYHGNFRDMAYILDELGISGADGILLDLGVSSPQLDEAERGFSYMEDAPLDMRMDRSCGMTAAELVNTAAEEELSRILFEYGEERYSRRIAGNIVRYREKKRIETTLELVGIIKSAMPSSALREKQHPAKRSFQALRIAVNDELGALTQVLENAVGCLNAGGRLAIITFHSLEDRLVKKSFKQMANPCTCPPELPMCVCGKKPMIDIVTGKPIVPTPEEIERNPRARSAKLRVAVKRDL